MSKTRLIESVIAKPLRIDREAGIIYGVRVLGLESKGKNREYTEGAHADAERRKLYEGMEVNLDHPAKKDVNGNRPFIESWGVLRTQRRDSLGTLSDLHYLKTHPLTESILERAERFPENFGLSHNAFAGRVFTRNGKQVVESIASVNSVDLVRNPATTTTLFESGTVMSKSLKEAVESLDAKHEGRQLLLEAMTGEKPLLDPAATIELAESANEQEVAAAIYESATGSIIRAGGKFSDVAKLFGAKAAAPVHPPIIPPATGSSTEIKSLQESLTKLQHSNLVRDLLEEHGIQRGNLSPENRRLLESQVDETAMRTLIESWPPAVRGVRKPFVESARGGTGGNVPSFLPEDAKSFADSVR